jgi:hypothetical protein
MTVKWTIEERMPLYHLFALIGYLAKDNNWWRLYEEIQHPTRGRTLAMSSHRIDTSDGHLSRFGVAKASLCVCSTEMYVFSLLEFADVSLLTLPWNRQDATLFDDDDPSTLYINFH